MIVTADKFDLLTMVAIPEVAVIGQAKPEKVARAAPAMVFLVVFR